MDLWSADEEKLRELKLTGKQLDRWVGETGNADLFVTNPNLNFLEFSGSSQLKYLPDELGRLSCLTNLVLCGNRLEKLPNTLGALKKLKCLDVARNVLVELPSTIGDCSDLQTLIVAHNRLPELPSSLSYCGHLAHVDASHNEFKVFPSSLANKNLQHLAEISLKGNMIDGIPGNISEVAALKSLDLSDNKILVVPGELGDCQKLRDLQLGGNELLDRRFRKLIEDGVQKAILSYVKKNCPRTAAATTKEMKSNKSGTKNKDQNAAATEEGKDPVKDGESGEQEAKNIITVMPSRSEAKVIWKKEVAEIRPYAIFCIVWDMDFADPKSLKEFFALQTKLHEIQCHKRVAATIATHDLCKIRFPICYQAKSPDDINIHPLGRLDHCTASELVSKLTMEAEQLRKEKKRHVYSGVHQYLYLVKDKTKYACLSDADGTVISFPPITNSDVTKLTATTKDVLLEVTSDKDLGTCKRVMEALLKGIFTSSLIRPGDNGGKKSMTVEQVKIEQEDGSLRVAFPSKVDLAHFGENIAIVREWDKVGETVP